MIDRASTFANPQIVQFLKNNVIPVAIDQAYQRRQQDTEGEFYRRIVQQSPRKDFGNNTTQGLFMASAAGDFLGFTNHRSPQRVMQMLTESLSRAPRENTAALERQTVDRRYNPEPPDGGLIVRVQAKILSGYDPPESQFQQIFQTALSRDNLWITQSEHAALVAGRVPQKLIERLARFHLVDNTRGEPPMWALDEIQSARLNIKGTMLQGRFRLATADGRRSYEASLRGELAVEQGRVVKFNAVVLGTFSGEGRYTRNAPKEPFPLAISLTLADGSDIADSVPPQGGRGWIDGYLK